MISVFDQNNMKKYIEILKKLRSENISSEIYPGEGKIKNKWNMLIELVLLV